MWRDEIMRSGFGFLACWPAISACQHFHLSPAATTALVTVYMVPVWRLYRWLDGRFSK